MPAPSQDSLRKPPQTIGTIAWWTNNGALCASDSNCQSFRKRGDRCHQSNQMCTLGLRTLRCPIRSFLITPWLTKMPGNHLRIKLSELLSWETTTAATIVIAKKNSHLFRQDASPIIHQLTVLLQNTQHPKRLPEWLKQMWIGLSQDSAGKLLLSCLSMNRAVAARYLKRINLTSLNNAGSCFWARRFRRKELAWTHQVSCTISTQ